MYEQYFREFVAFLFPNDLLDELILDFVEGEQELSDMEKCKETHGIDFFTNDERTHAIMMLTYILEEMRKSEPNKPSIDMIDYCLGEAMIVLERYNPTSINKLRSFRTFLLWIKHKESGVQIAPEDVDWLNLS
ncbi:MAG: hypothetical protein ACD_8C00138G0012 [uncultured bacterium]|nr:MAG: hypothetical protein ACD_8C00138G0012 [uncultured bacterium]